jgi:hypothetical protein
MPRWTCHGALGLACLVAACGTDEPLSASVEVGSIGFDAAATEELRQAGVDRYLGQFTAAKVEKSSEGEVYTFTPSDDGPVCLYGDEFRVSTREGSSDDLLIFLQGGGACWSDLCAANTSAGFGILPIGWTDSDPKRNPALARFDVVFVSYCDGSVFSGDSVILANDGSIERRHRGLANLSAGIDVARLRHPKPRRIVLAGTSAGGYGTILGAAVVRLAYPHTPLFVVNDGGIGLTNPEDPSLADAIADEWKVLQFLPASCGDCVENGQFTGIVGWALDHDPSLRVADFSSYQDGVIGGVFLGMEGPDFEKLLVEETGKLHAAHPDRFERFFVKGSGHTALLAGYYDVSIEGQTLIEWIQAMLDGSDAWQDRLE